MKLEIDLICNSYGKNKVLQGVSLVFDKPGITAILGPNGSGKTTLIKCILGMVIPNKGDILFNEESIKSQWTYKAEIDYLPQIARFPDNLRFKELLSMMKNIRGASSREIELLEYFDMNTVLNQKMGHLSGGTRQKANLVLALMFDNPLMILDEPTTGLDPISLIKFKSFIQNERKRGKTILISTHILSLVEELADNVVFLLEGKKYYQGSLEDLKTSFNEQNLENTIAQILMENQHVEGVQI